MAGSLIFRVMYGYQVSKNHDPFITGAEELMVKSSWIISSPWLVDFVPMRESMVIDLAILWLKAHRLL